MNTSKLMIAAVACAAGLMTIDARAEIGDTGISPYISAQIGYGAAAWKDMDILPHGVMYSGAVGASIRTSPINLRAEFEYAGAKHVASESDEFGVYPNYFEVELDPTIKSALYMANLYVDFLEDYALKPYLGVGLGRGKLTFSEKEYDFYTGDYMGTWSASESGMTWGAYAGIGFKMFGGLSGDIGARFNSVDAGDGIYLFGLNAGLRYNF